MAVYCFSQQPGCTDPDTECSPSADGGSLWSVGEQTRQTAGRPPTDHRQTTDRPPANYRQILERPQTNCRPTPDRPQTDRPDHTNRPQTVQTTQTADTDRQQPAMKVTPLVVVLAAAVSVVAGERVLTSHRQAHPSPHPSIADQQGR